MSRLHCAYLVPVHYWLFFSGTDLQEFNMAQTPPVNVYQTAPEKGRGLTVQRKVKGIWVIYSSTSYTQVFQVASSHQSEYMADNVAWVKTEIQVLLRNISSWFKSHLQFKPWLRFNINSVYTICTYVLLCSTGTTYILCTIYMHYSPFILLSCNVVTYKSYRFSARKDWQVHHVWHPM